VLALLYSGGTALLGLWVFGRREVGLAGGG